MPLCTDCKSEAVVQNVATGETVGDGRRTDSNPPHGMDWGDECDRCGQTAEVAL